MTAPAQQQSPQDMRAQAAAQAAAIIAAAKTPQAVELRALAAIRLSAGVTQRAEDTATRLITAAWAKTNPYDDASVEDFAATAGRIVVAAQRSVATATSAAQVSILRAQGVADARGGGDIPDDVRGSHVHSGADEPTVQARPKAIVVYRGPDDTSVHRTVTADDAQPSRVFVRVAKTYRFSASQGADPTNAHDAAVQRIGSIVDGNLMLAQRLAEQQTLRNNPTVVGYRRVIHPELSKGGVCGLCVAASDRVYKTDELKPIHDRCKCTVAPVIEGGPDVGFRLNRDDLTGLYTDGGSTASPDLKRTRYDVVHHHELGPILVRVRGEKVPYYSVHPPAAAA